MGILNKHAPLRRFKVKGRNNPWFSDALSTLFHKRDLAWAKARRSGQENDWVNFRYLRNKCTTQIRKAKSQFYLDETTRNLKNPAKFWRIINSMKTVQNSSFSALPKLVNVNNVQITDKNI